VGIHFNKNPIGSSSAPVGGNGTLALLGVAAGNATATAASRGGDGGRGNVNPVGMIIGGCIWAVWRLAYQGLICSDSVVESVLRHWHSA
jgi:hypothetical protein